jgi:hypothetical protein
MCASAGYWFAGGNHRHGASPRKIEGEFSTIGKALAVPLSPPEIAAPVSGNAHAAIFAALQSSLSVSSSP